MKEKRERIRIGVMVSGGGSNLQAIIDACHAQRIAGDIVCVGSDNEGTYGLERAKKAGIPSFVVNYKKILGRGSSSLPPLPDDFDLDSVLEKQNLFPKRKDDRSRMEHFFKIRSILESELLDKLKPFRLNLLVLAGFMRVLTPYFIDRFDGGADTPNIMNIHPALLPAFPGEDGYGDAFRFGCKIGGCTVHFVDYGADTGPIIGQRAFPILPDDTLERVRKKGLSLEWELYPECIALFAENRLKPVRLTYEEKGSVYQRVIVKIAITEEGIPLCD